jgi:hypothetical protein
MLRQSTGYQQAFPQTLPQYRKFLWSRIMQLGHPARATEGRMAVVNLGDEPAREGIDLDRVIVDPDYRRRVMEKLRVEAESRRSLEEPITRSGHGD